MLSRNEPQRSIYLRTLNLKTCPRVPVSTLQRERSNTSLPQVPPPPLSEVHKPGIPAMRFPDRLRQAFLALRNRHQVNVVRHQAVRPYLHIVPCAPLLKQIQVCTVIRISEEHLLTPVSSLCNMMSITRRHHPRYPCHGSSLDQVTLPINN